MKQSDRRRFLRGAITAGTLVLTGAPLESGAVSEEAEVTPAEDLMQEHGVIQRIMLVYDEAERRLAEEKPFERGVLVRAAALVRRFIEDYHERTEEDVVFPRLEKAGKETRLVATLRDQHRRGRELTDSIRQLAATQNGNDRLRDVLRAFTRMYRPHAASEDTVAFPSFRSLLGRKRYSELGEQLEQREHALFGKHGFEDVVNEVAKIERQLGIDDLATLTP